jgi:hypothetical protein
MVSQRLPQQVSFLSGCARLVQLPLAILHFRLSSGAAYSLLVSAL